MRIGFIGAGGIAGNYRNSPAKTAGAKVVAVCDVNPDTLAKVAAAEGATAEASR